MLAFVGSRTTRERHARGAGLSVFQADQGASNWRLLQTVDLVNPSFLCIDAAARRLYTVHGDGSEVSAFAVDAQGLLRPLNSQSTRGRNPVHLALSRHGGALLVANYATGTLACLPVRADGSLAPCRDILELPGTSGPHRAEQNGPHPHQVLRWPGSDLFLVPDKGTDQVHVIRLLPDGRLERVNAMPARPGCGPRHAAVDAANRRVWICNELDSTVTACSFDADTGALAPSHIVPLLRPDSLEDNRAAGIAVHPNGRTLYVSNRGADAISVMAIDPRTGEPRCRQWVGTLGKTPRFLTLTPDARALIVANEASDSLARFCIGDEGLLDEGRLLVETGSPVCVSFLPSAPRHPEL